LILLDSSAWIEYFNSSAQAPLIEKEISKEHAIIIPTLVIFEVYRKITKTLSMEEGLSAMSSMSSYDVVDLTKEIALHAADLSIQYDLPMADSCILATAEYYNVKLITFDHDFTNIPNVKILKK